MGFDANTLKDEDVLYGYLPEFLDGEIPGFIAERFQKVVSNEKNTAMSTQFQEARGRFQVLFQDIALDEAQLDELRELVNASELRKTQEMSRIEKMGRMQAARLWGRRLFFVSALIGIVVGGYFYFRGPVPEPFDVLSTLSYEASALFQDSANERLNFPTESLPEVVNFFSEHAGFKVVPAIPKNLEEGWKVVGASIIDYPYVKISVVKYKNDDKQIVQFALEGDISSLPKSTPGNYKGLIYQAYATDNQNIIVWQQQSNLMGCLISSLGAVEIMDFITD